MLGDGGWREYRRRIPLHPDGLLVAASLCCAAVYLWKGVGFVLDDWYYLRNAEFDGALHAAGSTGGDRPVGALVYVALFGIVGRHPGALVVLLAATNGVTAILLRRLLRTRWSPQVSVGAALLWLLLPLRTSLEVWMSTGTAVLGQLLSVGGLLVLARARPGSRWALTAPVLICLGVLSYESVGVVAIPLALLVRLAATNAAERFLVGLLVLLPAGALWWAFVHRLPGRQSQPGLRSPLPVLDANFGSSLAPNELLGALLLISAIVGSVVVLRSGGGPVRRLLGLGWLITSGGVIPYLTYFYSPYGAGDRLNMLSALGAVLVWAALLAFVVKRHTLIGCVASLALVALGLWARWDRAELWSRAAEDSTAIASAVVSEHPDAELPIVIGPRIVVEGIAGLYDHSNVAAALQLAYGRRDVEGYIALTCGELEALDPREFIRFDQRSISTLDGAEE